MFEFGSNSDETATRNEKDEEAPAVVRHSEAGSDMLTFEDLTFTVKAKDAGKTVEKKIIQGITGQVLSGHVLAILGPSGAGKTTLINVLTLTAFGGVSTGSVKLNDAQMNQNLFKKACVVVAQQVSSILAALATQSG